MRIMICSLRRKSFEWFGLKKRDRNWFGHLVEIYNTKREFSLKRKTCTLYLPKHTRVISSIVLTNVRKRFLNYNNYNAWNITSSFFSSNIVDVYKLKLLMQLLLCRWDHRCEIGIEETMEKLVWKRIKTRKTHIARIVVH